MREAFLLLTVVLFSFTVFAQDVEIATKYNDRIVELNANIISSFDKLIDSYEKYIPEEMDSSYAEALATVNYGIKKIKRLAPFENDSNFKIRTLVLFKTYKMVLEDEYNWIIKLLKLPENDYGAQQAEEVEKYIEDANNQCDKAIEKLMIIQENFVKKYNIELTND